MKHNLSKLFSLSLILSLFFACEKEFSELGSGIVGAPNIEIKTQSYPVKSYNKRITPFQSNGLPKNLLGYHKDPVFGPTTVHFLAQLTPRNYNVNFGDNPVLDSVVLTIPYAVKKSDDEYTIDSLYGEHPVKLSIFKNNFLLRDFDPNSDLDENQRYFSDGSLSSSEQLNAADMEGQLLYTTSEFFPSNEEIILTEVNDEGETETSATLTPSLRLKLDELSSLPENFWEDLILEKEDSDELSSANNFYNYFRGLYFKVEAVDPDNGHLIQLDFATANAHVKLFYNYENTGSDGGTTTKYSTYDMAFSGNRVSIYENDFDASILQSIANANEQDGDERLYLKGGEGSMAVVELFSEDESGNDFDDFITDFRENSGDEILIKRLVNEAYLEFYIDEAATGSDADHPNRIFVYDLNNNTPLVDYYLDNTVNTTTSDSKYTHLVPVSTETDDQGTEHKKYKVRLTGHLNNIVTKDSTNVKIGLLVSSNVGAADMRTLQQYDENVEFIPTGTILSPKSVILHGSNSSDELKKVKLKVYYTEPTN
ncbi:DUF4270 domain-containing protein [Flavobacteriaceae bacterium]|nr:DUF4270 domain-containing protein [Flavobacteriaceae bacterium]MDB2632506.1 DUF4270 domain-containing protein [Flavobacteriaceae bacterium]